MNFKLVKNEIELKNFVEKYKNKFEYLYEVVFESQYPEVNKYSLFEYIEFMYKNLKLDRFFTDFIFFLEEKESKEINYCREEGNIYVEVEEFYALPNSGYQKKRQYWSPDEPSYLENNKFNDFLYNVLNYYETILLKNGLPKGILKDRYNVDESLLKEYLGLKDLNIGIEFEIEFLDDQNKNNVLIRRKLKFKLLDYRKEIRTFQYRVFLFLNVPYKLKSFTRFSCPENLLDLFLERFVYFYDMYVNNQNNLEIISNYFDYEKNKFKIMSFINDFYLEEIKIVRDEFTYPKYEFSQININDMENFNKEYAHYLFLSSFYSHQKCNLYYIREYGIYWNSGCSFENLTKDKTLIEDLFLRNMNRWRDCIQSETGRNQKDYMTGTIWIKGFGKYKDI